MEEKDVTFLDQVLVRTKSYVDRIEDAVTRELERYSTSRFYGPLTYALQDGKKIRPLIVLLSAESVGKDGKSPLDAAVAVELLHAESIIHDDIIDKEVSRRGKAAFHVRYGYNASLLTADFVFAMILAIAARYQDREVTTTLSNAALRMCEGEFAELVIDPASYELGWDEYEDIIFNKTASLFETAGRLGGLTGKAPSAQVEALSNFGKYVGMAYQIHDDMLDWGTEDKITISLRQRSDETTVTSRLKALSEMYAKKAKEQLALLPDSPARSLLVELTDFSVQRNY